MVHRAQRLLVYTIDAANFSDKMDIIIVAEMIEKFGKFVEKFKDVSAAVDYSLTKPTNNKQTEVTTFVKTFLQACTHAGV